MLFVATTLLAAGGGLFLTPTGCLTASAGFGAEPQVRILPVLTARYHHCPSDSCCSGPLVVCNRPIAAGRHKEERTFADRAAIRTLGGNSAVIRRTQHAFATLGDRWNAEFQSVCRQLQSTCTIVLPIGMTKQSNDLAPALALRSFVALICRFASASAASAAALACRRRW